MYFPDKEEFVGYVTDFLEDCNNSTALRTTWIVKVTEFYEDVIPEVKRAAFQSDGYHSVEDNFLEWWDNKYDQTLDPDGGSKVEIFTNYTPSEISAPRLTNWFKENYNLTRLKIYFAFLYTGNEERRKVPGIEYVERLKQLIKCSNRTMRFLKVSGSVLQNWAEDIGVQFQGYHSQSYENESLERAIVPRTRISSSLLNSSLGINEPKVYYPSEREFQGCVWKFLNDCNDSGALGTTWIVKVTEFSEYQNPVVTRAAFRNDGFSFVEDNFLQWWDTAGYQRKFDSNDERTEVQVYTNYTPTEICAPPLTDWLNRNRNVTRFKMYFAFVYTWNEKRRKVPKEEYVRRLQNLRNLPYRSVKIGKVDKFVLGKLAKDAGVSFPGYEHCRYSNECFEYDIITDPDEM